NGRECVLRPGETLFIPALTWHCVEYLDTSVSFNLRFGRSPYMRYLSNNVPVHMYAQNIGALMYDADAFERAHPGIFQEVVTARQKKQAGALEKYQTLQRVLADIYARICADGEQIFYAFTDLPGLFDAYTQYRIEHVYLRYLAT